MTEYERNKVVDLIRGMTDEEKEIAREVLGMKENNGERAGNGKND